MTMAEENNNNKWAQFEEVHQSPSFQYPAVRCDRARCWGGPWWTLHWTFHWTPCKTNIRRQLLSLVSQFIDNGHDSHNCSAHRSWTLRTCFKWNKNIHVILCTIFKQKSWIVNCFFHISIKFNTFALVILYMCELCDNCFFLKDK